MTNVCSICLETPKTKLSLQCNHTFCFHCIHKWSLKHSSCPCCRKCMKNQDIPGMKQRFLDTCSLKIKKSKKAKNKKEHKKLVLDVFNYVVENGELLGVLKDNTAFLDLMINKYKMFSVKLDLETGNLLNEMVRMNERFKENNGTFI